MSAAWLHPEHLTAFGPLGRRAITALLCIALGGLGLSLTAGSASADFAITSFDGSVTNQDGSAATQAGAHPYAASTTFMLTTKTDQNGMTVPDEQVKNVRLELPPGFVGNPQALPRCTQSDFEFDGICPANTAVGIAQPQFVTPPGLTAVYNMEPPPGMPAQFAFRPGFLNVHLNAELRSDSDYGLTIVVDGIPQILPLIGTIMTFWGVPGDSSHDRFRGACIETDPDFDGDATNDDSCTIDGPTKPFLSNPTFCNGPLATTLRVNSWQRPDRFVSAQFMTHNPAPHADELVGPEGCDRLRFAPSMDASPSSSAPGTPTGLNVVLRFPQNGNPTGLDSPPLRTATVTLPEGMTINPSAADGLDACTDAQLGLHTNNPVGCPDGARIGTVTVTTPLLDAPLTGLAYLRSQASNDPQSGQMFRMALVLEDKRRGLLIKLPGSITADPTSGRLVTTFEDNPQLPLSEISLQLKSGPRAPLATPTTCGTKTTSAGLTSWAGQTANLDSSFTIDQSCDQAGRFDPTLQAGTVNPQAGGSSPFTLTLSRPDGQQDVNGLEVTLPPGVLGRVGSVPPCPEAQAAAGTCSPASQIGRTTVAAGAGVSPLYVPQAGKAPTAVYLAGPYKGAPYSLAIVVPAQAGPFDLGTVVVRAALFVDPIDAHVTVKSDPIPTILGGVPLRIQKLNVTIDRSGFMVSPTNCDPMQITGQVGASQGAAAAVASRFQVGDCASLALKPKLDLALSGKGQTTDGMHPAVTATVSQPQGGQANLKKVRVALPLSLALDPDNANGLCEFVDGSKVTPTCPKASIVGTATATTPILDEPLSGPVYFVKNIRKDPKSGREIRTLPKLVIPLTGQNGVKLSLTGTSNVENDQLVTTFDNIPDAPVSSFKLSIIGGKGGILTVSGTDICKATQVADQQIDGQNNKAADADVFIQTPSCPLKVISKKVGKTSVAVKVGGLGAGKVTVSGKGIRKTTKTISRSTVATITAKRSKGTPGKVTVSFDPTGPDKAHKTKR